MLIVSQMDVSFGQKSSGFHTKPFCSPKGRGEPAPGVRCYNPAPVWAFRAAFVLIVLFVGRRCRGYGGPEHRHGLDGVFKS